MAPRVEKNVIGDPALKPLQNRYVGKAWIHIRTSSDPMQLPNRRKIFGIYALTLLMYTVANPRGGGQLPNPNECNSTPTSETRGIYPHRYTD